MAQKTKHTRAESTNRRSLLGLPKTVTRQLKNESDRGAILVLAAYLEEILAELVRAACVDDDTATQLLELHHPAGDFYSKILLCTALALVHAEEARALRRVQTLRNRAAHFDKRLGFDVLFDSSETVDHVASLMESLNCQLGDRDAESVRADFIVGCRLLATKLLLRLVAIPRPKPLSTIKALANEARKGDSIAIGHFVRPRKKRSAVTPRSCWRCCEQPLRHSQSP